MTFDEYIKNPGGKNSAVMTNKVMYHNMYHEAYDRLKVKENGVFGYHLYQGKNDYYIHMYIPDESIPKFYYDTVVRFYLPNNKKDHEMDKNLSNYEVQFYSNDPAFIYTYAYVFAHNNLFIKDLENKMSKIALTQPPKVRNPKKEIGYVKDFYLLYLEMKSLNLFSKLRWEGAASYSKSVWSSTITNADDKLAERKSSGDELRKQERAKKNAEKLNQEAEKVSTGINTHSIDTKSMIPPKHKGFLNQGEIKHNKITHTLNTKFNSLLRKK